MIISICVIIVKIRVERSQHKLWPRCAFVSLINVSYSPQKPENTLIQLFFSVTEKNVHSYSECNRTIKYVSYSPLANCGHDALSILWFILSGSVTSDTITILQYLVRFSPASYVCGYPAVYESSPYGPLVFETQCSSASTSNPLCYHRNRFSSFSSDNSDSCHDRGCWIWFRSIVFTFFCLL